MLPTSAPAHLARWQAGRRGLREPHPWGLRLGPPSSPARRWLIAPLPQSLWYQLTLLLQPPLRPPLQLQPRAQFRPSIRVFASSLSVPAVRELLLRDSVSRPSGHGWTLLSSAGRPPGAQAPGFGWSWVSSRWVSAPPGICTSHQ